MNKTFGFIVICLVFMSLIGVLPFLMPCPPCAYGEITGDVVEDCMAEGQSYEEIIRCLEREAPPPPEKAPEAAPAISPPAAEEERKRREYRVHINTIAPQRYFVGNEAVQVRYEIYVPFDMRIMDLDYRESVKPFELVAVNTGRRFTVQKIKDLEMQRIVLTVRLPNEYGYGTYTLPALSIPYEYNVPEESGVVIKKGVATSKAVELVKVPLYVDVVQEHDIGFIADAITFRMEIHADRTAEVLNEYPPEEPQKNIVYLSAYTPEEPFMLLDAQRTESQDKHYRVIRWLYTVAFHDIDEDAFELPVPQVVWWEKDKRPTAGDISRESNIRIITPDPVRVLVRSITEPDEVFKPMKGVLHEPDDERMWLLTVPRMGIWIFSGAGVLLAFAHVIQLVRTRKRRMIRAPVVEMPERPRQDYDRWPHQRVLLKKHAQLAREAFQRESSRDRCIELRALLARQAAICLKKQEQISVQEACSMTASELERLVGETPEIASIRELDHQLETGEFRKLHET
jgi:hypothetical protein